MDGLCLLELRWIKPRVVEEGMRQPFETECELRSTSCGIDMSVGTIDSSSSHQLDVDQGVQISKPNRPFL
jgi:hypothetical protein